MFLKRLTCQGFKSFADKIEFDFQPGITGIVGPNGCGKSNVVDAIKWALGDQSAKSLRGSQMQDVIFFGSGTRKASNMAQVDLTFENADRRLPVEADEVTMTRRLYRSGESEYLINGEKVRLKDIKEVLMDTGIGLTAYSIIEQGKVAYLIQANPEQRRIVFEEAAGISRYKARKKEAERKLGRVEQNLLRIEDIVEEVEKRLRSIKYQAGKARNFQVYDQQLREKRAMYSLAEYHRLTEKIGTLVEKTEKYSDEVTRLRTTISEAEARESGLRERLDILDRERQELQQQLLSSTSEITEKRERIEQSQRQMEMLTGVRAREQERLAAERQRMVERQREAEAAQRQVEELKEKLDGAHAVEDELAAQDGELARQLAEVESQCEDEKAGIIELLRRTSQLNNEIEALARQAEQLGAERERLEGRQREVQAELDEQRKIKAGQDTRAEELAARIVACTQQIEAKQEQSARVSADQAELTRQLGAAKEHRSGMLSRKHTLQDLDNKLEGVDSGVREVLHRKERDETGASFSYVWGMVADLVAADVSNAVLIETALGDYDQYLVVEDSRALMGDAEMLADFPGRIPALCMDLLPAFENGRDFSGQEGFVAHAMDLVRYPSEAEPLVKHLLGRTIIVRSLADARQLAERNPSNYRYVTQSGELLDPQGVMHLGPAGGRAGLISRKSELREIDAQIAEVDERIAGMTERLEQASAEAARLQREQQELRNARGDARTAEAENNSERNATRNAIERLERTGPEIAADIDSVDMRITESKRRSEQCGEQLAHLEDDQEARQTRVEQANARIEALKLDRAQRAERLTRAKIEVAELRQHRGMVVERLRSLQQARQNSEEAVRAAAMEAQQAADRITQAERTILNAQSRLAELYASKEGLDRDILARGRSREEVIVEIERGAGQVKADRVALDEVEERLTGRQMDLREARIRIEELTSRVRQDLDIELAEAYESYEYEDQDWAAVEAEINDLKTKIQRLGNVNLDAISEQEELEQRVAFLTGQRDDLRESKKQLEELIEKLNTECRERFAQTFEAVRGNFNEMFRKLFGGGKAEIKFEDPPEGKPLDVLEAGIEILARPPGKELRTNSLLSGGEKTMAAIALLMAIFKSRPSPFALLDEVDAALDEANNERFNRIISEFLDTTQFVVITHQKPTMSIADILYGVTMQEAGVSKRVSVRFDSGQGQEDAAVA